jgi:hypothetical protein
MAQGKLSRRPPRLSLGPLANSYQEPGQLSHKLLPPKASFPAPAPPYPAPPRPSPAPHNLHTHPRWTGLIHPAHMRPRCPVHSPTLLPQRTPDRSSSAGEWMLPQALTTTGALMASRRGRSLLPASASTPTARFLRRAPPPAGPSSPPWASIITLSAHTPASGTGAACGGRIQRKPVFKSVPGKRLAGRCWKGDVALPRAPLRSALSRQLGVCSAAGTSTELACKPTCCSAGPGCSQADELHLLAASRESPTCEHLAALLAGV